MIKVNNYIINEKLIKYAIPYVLESPPGVAINCPPIATKIVFIDNSEMVFKDMDCYVLYNELTKPVGQ